MNGAGIREDDAALDDGWEEQGRDARQQRMNPLERAAQREVFRLDIQRDQDFTARKLAQESLFIARDNDPKLRKLPPQGVFQGAGYVARVGACRRRPEQRSWKAIAGHILSVTRDWNASTAQPLQGGSRIVRRDRTLFYPI